MKHIIKWLAIVCLTLFVSACSPIYDNFEGTYICYYLQNDTSKVLYYKLEGAPSNRESNGVVEIGNSKQLGWTEHFQLIGPPFMIVRIYDNLDRNILLFETSYNPNTSDHWVVERIDQTRQKYRQTLILTDEKIVAE